MRWKKRDSYMAVLLFLFGIGLGMSGCKRGGPISYTLTFQGTAEKSGVISFLDFSINVYQDLASNSCGDCEDQPAHLYVGASAEDAAKAAAQAVRDADNLWKVRSVEGTTVYLEEKKTGTVKEREIGPPKVPLGLTAVDNYNHKVEGEEVGEEEETKIIYGPDKETLTVPVKAERVAAVYGPSYEIAVVLGAEDRIVVCADVQRDNFPWAMRIFPRMAALPYLENVHSAVNFEELMTYKPDLVLTFSRPGELRQLEEAGVCSVPGSTTQTLAEVPEQLMMYARALGSEAVERAEKYEEYFNEKCRYVKERTKNLSEEERPTVYYAGIDLLTTYGKYSDIPELIETAGGKAVMGELQAGNHSQINMEQLAAWNPEYIFIDHGGMNENKTVEELKEEAGTDSQYSSIRAVKEGNLYLTPSGTFYWDMGLQKILLLMYVAKTVQPELFTDLNMAEEIQGFYKEFYGYPLTIEEAERILDRQDP